MHSGAALYPHPYEFPCSASSVMWQYLNQQSDWLARIQDCWVSTTKKPLNCHQTLSPWVWGGVWAWDYMRPILWSPLSWQFAKQPPTNVIIHAILLTAAIHIVHPTTIKTGRSCTTLHVLYSDLCISLRDFQRWGTCTKWTKPLTHSKFKGQPIFF